MHGPTAEENLVTLCGTCHKGLDPDFEPALRELAKLPGSAVILDLENSEYKADVDRYREWVTHNAPDETDPRSGEGELRQSALRQIGVAK